MKGKSLVTLADFSKEEILKIIEMSEQIKRKMKNKEPLNQLQGYSMAMIFQKRSTRTRVSTETGMTT